MVTMVRVSVWVRISTIVAIGTIVAIVFIGTNDAIGDLFEVCTTVTNYAIGANGSLHCHH